MFYGKQINSAGEDSYISSSLPLPYSDTLIALTEEEFNIFQREVELKQKQKYLLKKQQQLNLSLVEPNQVIEIQEKDI